MDFGLIACIWMSKRVGKYVEFSDFSRVRVLLNFLGIIGCSKNPEIFTVGYPGY